MLYRRLGNTELEASVVAIGAWAIGGWAWGGTDEKDAIASIHAGLDAGINMIDTAPVYGFGTSEELVGKATKDRRDQVLLATKCGLVWDREKGKLHFHSDEQTITTGPSKYNVYKYLGRESIRDEVERSLRRLQTDHIDLYQTHWQDPTTPISETMEALMELRQEGKIRAIGVSNATVSQIQEYGPIDCDQERFSMLDRKLEKTGQLKFLKRHGISMLAYSPLAMGLLTGKMTPDRTIDENDIRGRKERFSPENRQKVQDMLEKFAPIREQHDITDAQLALAWAHSREGATHVLAGARKVDQAQENARAGQVRLTEEDMQTIDTIIQEAQVI